ncbi:MAG: aminoacetone oxidase family FAD-binding enzyme [Atopobiaceae bacterium]|nr:aminoacetone oxidase family FAD-binding enzyme [Atopobiaceae bacterium]
MAARGKRVSRAQQRAARARHAASVTLPTSADVCVVGGGAAGLTAAIVAAEKGCSVVVLERDEECGRTILATGNGRCNFANAQLAADVYNDATFVARVAGAHWLDDVLEFFRTCGLAWAEEAEGRLYPVSRQAASVRNVLLARAARAGVTLAPLREVAVITRTRAGFAVGYRELFAQGRTGCLDARAVVIASGGGTPAACLGLGLRAAPFVPLLCPLACTGPALDALDGRRAHANVGLERDGTVVMAQRGEVLFRPYGLSGIVVFDLSRHARPGDRLLLDLMPDVTLDEAQALATHTIDGLLDPAIAHVLVSMTSSTAQALELGKRLTYRVEGTADDARAQVSRGGLLTSQFDPTTLQAHAIDGLFACGEALDVDGPCGGYNLAWAWKSGLVCGTATAGRLP